MTTQEVIHYRTDFWKTAPQKFRKDCDKKLKEGWRLVSSTITDAFLGRAKQITAIYEKD
ncbi:hypothetical protein [Ktedonospora formicarum]|uniref:DUF4177 domain-containing protein n=1 Tax=Ktedonospora formicarum TaxID=2778364 RepID=A0A8J3HUX8_9CHLR|nr:hypothetical protein [Ktedonospora formicarum]GHO44507.1 hypothetical protein KSX_26700 [Ktedonospora formicarum]